MKKIFQISTVAATSLLAACSAALAQSSVSVSGRIDLNFGKDIGSSVTRIGSGAMSHLAFSGTEDLGQGQKAFFMLDSRINAQDGSTNTPGAFLNTPTSTFWSQASYVGMSGSWGSLSIGRHMTGALLAQIMVDPWQWDNTTTIFKATSGSIGNLWYNNAVTYDLSAGAFSLTAQVAEKENNPGWANATKDSPYSFTLGYAPGAFQFYLGYERPSDGTSHLLNLFGSYTYNGIAFNAMVGDGRDYLNTKVRTWALSSVIPVGVGQIRAAYGNYEYDGEVSSQKLSGGYYHYLSKRTAVYANYTYDAKAVSSKSGYELGLQHTF